MVEGMRRYLQMMETEIATPIAKLFLYRVNMQFSPTLLKYEERTLPRMATILDPRYDTKQQAFRSPNSYREGKKALLQSYSVYEHNVRNVDNNISETSTQ